jgi:hypothetical protein
VRGQFRFVDVNDGVERIKDERGIMHGSLGARFPPNTSALRAPRLCEDGDNSLE